MRILSLAIALMAGRPTFGWSQGTVGSWLDASKPVSWNRVAAPIPTAPEFQVVADPRCREAARPTQLDEDKRVHERGWNLVGAYQGGWDVLVIRGAAGYDGMCRPLQYQDFVFVRGVFTGTLSPQAMNSRTDGALERVSLHSATRLMAEYARYAATDALCCPSRTTSVSFEIASEGPVVRPVAASTSNPVAGQAPTASSSSGLVGTSWQLVKFQGGDDRILMPDDRSKYTIDFGAGGQLTARMDCR